MKKVAWLFALVVGLSVVGCSKPSSEVEPIASGEIINELSVAVNEQVIDDRETKELVAENTIKKEVNPKSLKETGYYNNASYEIFSQIPLCCNDDFPKYHTDQDDYDEYEKEFIESLVHDYVGIVVSETNKENRTINGYQKIKVPSGKEIIYEFQYQLRKIWPGYPAALYAANYYRLTNPEDVINQSHTGKPLDVNIDEITDGDEFERLSLIFNNYINEKIDFDELGEFIVYKSLYLKDEEKAYNEQVKNNKFTAKKIIKSNFTNSGYDEYLAIFNRGKSLDDASFQLEEYVEIFECIIMDNDVPVDSYRIDGIYSQILDLHWHKKNKFSPTFSQGYVADFNKNGFNEILFLCESAPYSECIAIEFTDNHFESTSLIAAGGNFDYDWENEYFTTSHSGTWKDSFGFDYLRKIAWSESEKCYLIFSEELLTQYNKEIQ